MLQVVDSIAFSVKYYVHNDKKLNVKATDGRPYRNKLIKSVNDIIILFFYLLNFTRMFFRFLIIIDTNKQYFTGIIS